MVDWRDLEAELDRWADGSEPATLWWRDDDASDLTPAAERLLALAERHGVPAHLAIVPASLTDALAARLDRSRDCRVLQHGYAHADHAPKGAGSWELGDHRPLAVVLAELETGRKRLAKTFGERFLPVMVPPWTRISDRVTQSLAGIGFRALSIEGARSSPFAAPRLLAINTHCDPIRWKGGAHFRGADRSLRMIVDHLRDRREGRADLTEPTGLCTHHLALDGEGWGFVEEFLQCTAQHEGARWIALDGELSREREP